MDHVERFKEFEARAHEVTDALRKATDGVRPIIELQFMAAHRADKNVKALHWVRKAAETLGSAVAPLAACGRGCSACCHVPVMLLASEARHIGREIGVVPKVVPLALRNQAPPTWRGADYPCPFLRDHVCQIYSARPLACRVLYNLDRDALLCQHGDEPKMVPYVDVREFSVNVVGALVDGEEDFIAELRDFF